MDGAGQVGMKLEFSSDRFARMDWMTAKGREEPVASQDVDFGIPAAVGSFQYQPNAGSAFSWVVDTFELDLRSKERVFNMVMDASAGNPCFKLDDQRTLCPKLAEVSARAYVGSNEMDGKNSTTKQLMEIGNFYGRDRPKLIVRSLKSEDRISRADIYQHYESYQGEPKFERLDLTIDYVYDCSGPCPEGFKFNTEGLVVIQDLPIEPGTLELKQNKAGKLDFSVPIN